MDFRIRRGISIVRQTEQSECGLACLSMVSGFYNRWISLADLRREYSPSTLGMTLKSIVEIAQNIGFETRAVRCELEDLRALRLPAVLHWDHKHFVVLSGVSKSEAVIADPALGIRRLKIAEVDKRFTGVALELTPSARFNDLKKSSRLKPFDVIRFSRESFLALVKIVVLSILLQLFVLAAPLYIQLVIDRGIFSSSIDVVWLLALSFLFIKIFEIIVETTRSFVVQYLANIVLLDSETRLLIHLVKLPYRYFSARNIGDVHERFSSVSALRNMLVQHGVNVFVDGVLALSVVFLLFYYSWLLALVVLTSTALYAALRAISTPFISKQSLTVLEARGRQSTTFMEILRGIQTIKVLGLEKDKASEWRYHTVRSLNATVRMGNSEIIVGLISSLIFGLSVILVVAVGAIMVINSGFTIGMLVAFLAYKAVYDGRSIALIEALVQYRLLDPHLERISDIALSELEPQSRLNQISDEPETVLRLTNVSFKYSQYDKYVLEDVTFDLPVGKNLVITGGSGQGKSTLLKLAIGLFRPTSGEIQYGAVSDTLSGDVSCFRIGTVLQDDTLLSGTIGENISCFSDSPDLSQIRRCAELSSILDDIDSLPMGFSTLVGDMGSTLSAGQTQRVMLARALYKKPNLLIIDEGTSALDVATEKQVNRNLTQLGISRLCVAHRVETIAYADILYELKDGSLFLVES